MVKINSSLLALTLVTGSALAFSNEYGRRSQLEGREPDLWTPPNHQSRELQQDELFGRDLDVEELFLREYDLEAREPGQFSSLLGDEQHHIAGQPRDTTSSLQNRGFEDDENIFGRTYDLEAREPSRYSELFKLAKDFAAKHHIGQRFQHTVDAAGTASNMHSFGSNKQSSVQNREFVDDEEVFGRDLDAEELSGREYDFFDDLD